MGALHFTWQPGTVSDAVHSSKAAAHPPVQVPAKGMGDLAHKLVSQFGQLSNLSPRTSRFDRLKSHDSADLRDVVDRLSIDSLPPGVAGADEAQPPKAAPLITRESFEMEQADSDAQGPESNFKVSSTQGADDAKRSACMHAIMLHLGLCIWTCADHCAGRGAREASPAARDRCRLPEHGGCGSHKASGYPVRGSECPGTGPEPGGPHGALCVAPRTSLGWLSGIMHLSAGPATSARP